MMRTAIAFVVAVFWAGAAVAADLPQYAPAPAWVQPIAIPKTAPSAEGGALQPLLQDEQSFYGLDGDQVFSEIAIKVLSSQGLQNAGNIAINWNPETETLFIHRLNIIRGDQVIDLLAKGQKFIVLRRENNLELAMLDGTLTAAIQPEDLRVGDILDLAVTRKRRDPVFQGRSEGFAGVGAGLIGRVHIRELWPSSKPIRWRATEGLGTPVVDRTPDQVDVSFDLTNFEAPKAPLGAPSRFNHLAELEVTQFSSWADVSTLMAPLYRKAATLAPDSPLRAEVAKIKAASSDPKVRAAAALRLVQDQTRYVFLGMNFGGYIPADADVTWTRRFGDCKGKTALLLALLQELGIDAQPALVASEGGDGMNERLPMLSLFDHVLVQAHIGGATYWLDGTRLGDRDLDKLEPPGFRWALPVQPAGGALEKIDQPPLAEPQVDAMLRLDASAGLDAPAAAHLEYVLRGDEAIALNLRFSGATRADAERALRESWTRAYPWITQDKVDFSYDDAQAVMRLSMDGQARMDWRENGPVREFEIGESLLGRNTSFKREPGLHQDAPYAVGHPRYVRWNETIILPKGMTGFTLPAGPDVDQVIAGIAYKRTTRIQDGAVTMQASQRTLGPEFPAAEAESAAAELRALADTDVVVRTPRLTGALPPPSSQTPVDAAGFSARGVGYLNQRDYGRAIADLNRAVELDPSQAKYRYNRGVGYLLDGQIDQALEDFSQALVLDPKSVAALMARAEIYLQKGEDARAETDFEAAVRLAPDNLTIVMRRINAYDRNGRYDAAIHGLDQLIAQPPAGLEPYMLLNNRCWIRAKQGRELGAALADCDASLKLKPGAAQTLDSRGFVLLRMGQLDRAIADYDATLKQDPNQAGSLYGRGLAKLRKGLKAEGEADIAAAIRIDPRIAADFAAWGVKP